MKLWWRVLFTGAGLLALAGASSGCALISFARYAMDPDHPRDVSETIALPGLSEPVQVYLDRGGVPHIAAASQEDLFRAIGFMHGRDRFFQMDTMRRFARGRLSELIGEVEVILGTTVKNDATMRAWGFERDAEQDVAEIDPETRKGVDAYVEGVNAALALYPPMEYDLLGVEPEPWTFVDSLAVGRITTWSITHNWHQELSRLVLAIHVGVERAEQIYPSEAWHGGTSLAPALEQPRELPPAIAPEIRELFPGRPYAPQAEEQQAETAALAAALEMFGGASNGWVVSGRRTASGKPIVASDPHLTHFLPSFMYQHHISCPGLDVIGTTVPGLPIVAMGHNRKVAWAVTSAVADAIDLYVEKLDPADPGRVIGPAGPEPLITEEIVVRVREGSEMTERRITQRRTPRGPLINDMYPGLLPDDAPLVSLRWNASGAGDAIRLWGKANRAGSVAELREAVQQLFAPCNAILAGDVSGEYAIIGNCRLPLRKNHRGTFPVPAWVAAYDWTETVPAGAMPFEAGGELGYYAHGNNLMYDPRGREVLFQIDSGPSYRLDRMFELIEGRSRHTLKSAARMQGDLYLKRAERLVPFLLEDLRAAEGSLSERERTALRYLAGWDFHARAETPEAAIFFVTYREAYREALRDEVDHRGFRFLVSQRYTSNHADGWFQRVDHPVWDDRATPDRVERRPGTVVAAFKRAVAWLTEEQGALVSGWRWGRLHFLQPSHPFGGQPLIGDFFNLPRIEVGGALDSLWKSHFDMGHPEDPFRAMAGPVFRMVVDLADIDHGLWIGETGVSGWPGDPHYGDMYRHWSRLRYLPMIQDWSEIRRTAKAVLTLK